MVQQPGVATLDNRFLLTLLNISPKNASLKNDLKKTN